MLLLRASLLLLGEPFSSVSQERFRRALGEPLVDFDILAVLT